MFIIKNNLVLFNKNIFISRHGNGYLRKQFSSGVPDKKSPLNNFHLKYNAKMVSFAGFSMPIQYGSHSIIDSHLHTRSSASVFDVSHMLQTEVHGRHREQFMESICVADIQGLDSGKGTLSLFTNEKGGIMDDLIATKTSDDHLYIVSNASRREVDMKIMLDAQKSFQEKGLDVTLRFYEPDERALIALQGPKAAQALKSLVDIDLSKFYFMYSTHCSVAGISDCRVSRVGYTGEDGVEISVPAEKSEELMEILLSNEDVKLAGLGARDSLRLEAGLCLYGNDMDESTTPVEAALSWTIGKRRRETKDFPGADIILNQIKEGAVNKKRVGVVSTGVPIRQGYEVLSTEDGSVIGTITSGCPSPTLKKNIAMAYIGAKFAKVNTEVRVKVRDRLVPATITKVPFVKNNYFTPPK